MADETRDNGGAEQLSVCLRYVRGAEIVERFIGFFQLEKFDARAITDSIRAQVERCGVSLRNCVAQSYDGASVMSGDISGVQSRIREAVGGECPYVHCHNHRLNLALVECCSRIPYVRELLGLTQAVHSFEGPQGEPASSEGLRRGSNKLCSKCPKHATRDGTANGRESRTSGIVSKPS